MRYSKEISIVAILSATLAIAAFSSKGSQEVSNGKTKPVPENPSEVSVVVPVAPEPAPQEIQEIVAILPPVPEGGDLRPATLKQEEAPQAKVATPSPQSSVRYTTKRPRLFSRIRARRGR